MEVSRTSPCSTARKSGRPSSSLSHGQTANLLHPRKSPKQHGSFSATLVLKEPNSCQIPPHLVGLESSLAGFCVRAGQKSSTEILRNVESSSSVQPHSLKLLLSLGWPVDVGRCPGWTGHRDTSWFLNSCSDSSDIQQAKAAAPSEDTGGSGFSGRRKVLYYAGSLTETAFIVPSLTENPEESSVHSEWRQTPAQTSCLVYSDIQISHWSPTILKTLSLLKS